MKDQPLVSVIMNCFNGGRYLREAISSVYNQNYSNFEIIFWDNNSSDNSIKIAMSFDDRVKYFSNSITTSLGQARNSAMKKAKGRYICFLDTDDIYADNKFNNQIKLMSDSNLMMSYGSIRFFRDNKTIWFRNSKNKTGYLIKNLLKDYEIHMNTVMLDSKLLTNKEYHFNTNLYYSPDFNLFMKIALKHKIGVLRSVIGNSRVHDNSLTRKLLSTIPKEHIFTLNEINLADPITIEKYKKNYDYAVKKTKYYEAIAYISEGQNLKAKRILNKIIFTDLKYFILYLILFLPINNSSILKILKR